MVFILSFIKINLIRILDFDREKQLFFSIHRSQTSSLLHDTPPAEKNQGQSGRILYDFLKKDLQKKDKCGIINPKMRF